MRWLGGCWDAYQGIEGIGEKKMTALRVARYWEDEECAAVLKVSECSTSTDREAGRCIGPLYSRSHLRLETVKTCGHGVVQAAARARNAVHADVVGGHVEDVQWALQQPAKEGESIIDFVNEAYGVEEEGMEE